MKQLNGFSLLELSIVIVIIGLIAGGVVGGRTLIRSASIRGVLTELSEIESGMNVFQVKYDAIPGDFKTATQLWGRADGGADLMQNCADPVFDYSATDPKATCNGNEDHYLSESFRFWQHLSNAGLIAGQYTGVPGPNASGWEQVPGMNCPEASVDGAGFTIMQLNPSHANWLLTPTIGRFMEVGLPDKAYGTYLPAFTPSELYAMDSKMDDGKPGQGRIHTYKASSYACVTNDNPATATYVTNSNATVCSLKFSLF